jgi:hypothetical protein
MSGESRQTAAGLYSKGGYLAHNPTWHVEDGIWKAAEIKLLLEHNHLKVESICEVGCGQEVYFARLATGLLQQPALDTTFHLRRRASKTARITQA